jgi:hypothetical protein
VLSSIPLFAGTAQAAPDTSTSEPVVDESIPTTDASEPPAGTSVTLPDGTLHVTVALTNYGAGGLVPLDGYQLTIIDVLTGEIAFGPVPCTGPGTTCLPPTTLMVGTYVMRIAPPGEDPAVTWLELWYSNGQPANRPITPTPHDVTLVELTDAIMGGPSPTPTTASAPGGVTALPATGTSLTLLLAATGMLAAGAFARRATRPNHTGTGN